MNTYYDYRLQVWVTDGKITPCGHPAYMRSENGPCCNAAKYAGHRPEDITLLPWETNR